MSIKKGVVYVFISYIIKLVISIFTGFVLPKILSIDSYANIKLFQVYITYIGVLHFGFSDGMYLRIGGKNIETIKKTEILEEFKTFKIFQLVIAIVAVIISVCLRNEILLLCSIVIFPINIAEYLKKIYQAIGQFDKYSKFTNIDTIFIFIVNVFLLFIIKTDYYRTYIFGYIVSYLIYWILIELEAKKIFVEEKVKSNIKYLIQDIKSGFVLMIGNFCDTIFMSIDRLFVQNLLGSIQFAYYSFAVSIEGIINTFSTPINIVMYNYLCNNKEREKVINAKKYILMFFSAILAIIFPVKFIINIGLEKYKNALDVLFLLFATQYISIIIRCIHVNLYKAEKRQKRYFKIMIIIVVLSILLNLILYNIFKTIGAIAIATFITNVIWFIIGEYEFRDYRLKRKDYVYMLFVISIFLICGLISSEIIGLIIYCFMILMLVIFFEKETFYKLLKEIKGEAKKLLNKII